MSEDLRKLTEVLAKLTKDFRKVTEPNFQMTEPTEKVDQTSPLIGRTTCKYYHYLTEQRRKLTKPIYTKKNEGIFLKNTAILSPVRHSTGCSY
ncbi:hypothetical protein [Sutcliffiella horikoshii]|uniref:hypothetical protein n=1 Tax=Sutcliffiella horikoshii TaxID=79883 RepID=UPI001CFEFA3E|nr:hypothetical protein [Sutcliffiella horikoshii]